MRICSLGKKQVFVVQKARETINSVMNTLSGSKSIQVMKNTEKLIKISATVLSSSTRIQTLQVYISVSGRGHFQDFRVYELDFGFVFKLPLLL